MKNPKFSHKTPHLKLKQHQLDPNIYLKHLVHHSTVQYVDRDADGDVDIYDNPKKGIPDENVSSASKAQEFSKKLIAKQKGEIKHSKKRVAYEGSLHKWFKSSSSKEGKPGWVNVVTGGTCASDEPGEGVPKCVSSAKRASMTPEERRSASQRKKAADPGQQQKSGAAKPTYVSTDKPKNKMNEAKERDHEYSMARSEISTIMNAAKRLKQKMAKGEGNVEAWVQSKITKAADYLDSAADYVDSGEMSEEKDVKGKGSGKKDACYHKVKSRYSVWPSAYASGALVKCRKVGADNWGNKSEGFTPSQIAALEHIGAIEINESGQKCWKGYKKVGTQKLFGKKYNRCVKENTCPICGYNPCECLEGTVDEAVRIPSKTGNIILVNLNWRGKYLMIKMFFPQTTKPNRREIQDQLDKVYPGAKVQSYYISDIKPGEQFLQIEDWQKVNRQDRTDGLSPDAVKAYRRENPGSKLQTAVTEKNPSGKRAKRRASFCRRMKGMKSKLTSTKTARDPDSRINKALRRWNCN